MSHHNPSQRYLSSRGAEHDLSFEYVVLQGLGKFDGGLYLPEAIPKLPVDWQSKWSELSFQQLAFEIFSLYISEDEIPHDSLRQIIHKSYATFRDADVTPTVSLNAEKNLYLLELFHGETYAFKVRPIL
jgi:threonine synthase